MGFELESEAIRRRDRNNMVDMKPPGKPTGAHGTVRPDRATLGERLLEPPLQLIKARFLIYRVVLHGNPVKTVVRNP
jgi:hypothetical protein